MRAVALVDGEHYPPVTIAALDALAARGDDIVAAVMLGGIEKLKGALRLGDLPIVTDADPCAALVRALDEYRPEVVIDVSDAPVVDTALRFGLIARALAAGVTYRGADFRFDPPQRPVLTTVPTIAVIGTGKRTGKTAVAGALARHLTARGASVVIVAMGRGGPPEPVVVRGAEEPPTVEALLALAAAGRHAASDVYEDAALARVTAVGARRAGGGFAGATVDDTVAAAVAAAEAEGPDVIILEGSGTAIPPAHADATVLVVGGATPPGEITGALGPYRLLISDLAVVTMAEEPVLRTDTLSALHSTLSGSAYGSGGPPGIGREVPIVETVFRPTPMEPIRGARIFVVTTAPDHVGPAIRTHLQDEHGAVVIGLSHHLADRPRLTEDLDRVEGTYDVLLTELKAAAIVVAARAATDAGARVVLADNLPVATAGDLAASFDAVWELAGSRGAQRS